MPFEIARKHPDRQTSAKMWVLCKSQGCSQHFCSGGPPLPIHFLPLRFSSPSISFPSFSFTPAFLPQSFPSNLPRTSGERITGHKRILTHFRLSKRISWQHFSHLCAMRMAVFCFVLSSAKHFLTFPRGGEFESINLLAPLLSASTKVGAVA